MAANWQGVVRHGAHGGEGTRAIESVGPVLIKWEGPAQKIIRPADFAAAWDAFRARAAILAEDHLERV